MYISFCIFSKMPSFVISKQLFTLAIICKAFKQSNINIWKYQNVWEEKQYILRLLIQG